MGATKSKITTIYKGQEKEVIITNNDVLSPIRRTWDPIMLPIKSGQCDHICLIKLDENGKDTDIYLNITYGLENDTGVKDKYRIVDSNYFIIVGIVYSKKIWIPQLSYEKTKKLILKYFEDDYKSIDDFDIYDYNGHNKCGNLEFSSLVGKLRRYYIKSPTEVAKSTLK